MIGAGIAVANPISVAPLETIGLIGFAWTSLGPPHVHWIAPLIFAGMIAVANVRIVRPAPESKREKAAGLLAGRKHG